MGLNFFATNAHDDVAEDRKILYWAIYDAVLPLLYAGTSVLNSIPNFVYDFVLDLSFCDKSEALKAIESDAGYAKQMVVSFWNTFQNRRKL